MRVCCMLSSITIHSILIQNGWAPLHLAVESKHERVVVSLLEHGADPNCTIATVL